MFKFVCLTLLTFASLSNAAWHLVWEDNFNGGNLKDRWNFEVNCDGGGNNELQCYTDNRHENCRQENGNLIIQARLENLGGGKPFTSTRMTTKANWLHGKFEIRARMPKGKHLWPAIWMMPAASAYGAWPRSGEIDITEYRGQKPKQILGTLHFGEAWNKKSQAGFEKDFQQDFSKNFHTFGLDWSPSAIKWLIDDRVVHTETLQRNFWQGLYSANGQPFDKNFFLILNLAVGGAFFGGERFEQSESRNWEKSTLEVDFVKKWEWR